MFKHLKPHPNKHSKELETIVVTGSSKVAKEIEESRIVLCDEAVWKLSVEILFDLEYPQTGGLIKTIFWESFA